MSGDVCDRFPVAVPEVPAEDEEPEELQPCDGCEEYRTGVRDGLCPECERKHELWRTAIEEGPTEVRQRLRREQWHRLGA